ncbi:kinase-like domain-containing protein [Podospora didyma]|uniref:Kinase-like domain-containing protein n=1 Tax=Podospora didyma TaxID=330526 RepID=A0AAE0N2R1_9PEZI|nr:kinase-like domain-containing protein [Podospora didyma]
MAGIYFEKLYKYREGGFCPIHIGDRIADRFTILHKLGKRHGMRYVALKVVAADWSEEYEKSGAVEILRKFESDNGSPGIFLVELKHFFHTSKNGQHLCQPRFVVEFAQQATKALEIMHSLGVCHGDFTLKNIAIELDASIDSLSEAELEDILGDPWKHPLEESEDEIALSRPKYGVQPVDLSLLPPRFLSTKLCVLDFDQSFLVDNPPKDLARISPPYLAPEATFSLRNGPPGDVWALGVPFQDGYPVHWPFEPGVEYDNFENINVRLARPLELRVREFSCYEEKFSLAIPEDGPARPRVKFYAENATMIKDKDAELFTGLLRKIFVFDPERRLAASQVLCHPWFHEIDWSSYESSSTYDLQRFPLHIKTTQEDNDDETTATREAECAQENHTQDHHPEQVANIEGDKQSEETDGKILPRSADDKTGNDEDAESERQNEETGEEILTNSVDEKTLGNDKDAAVGQEEQTRNLNAAREMHATTKAGKTP